MDQTKIGQIIATQRRKMNMTQSMLAEILNVSNKTVSRWETGVTMPDISLLIPISETLHISLNQLLGGGQSEQREEDLLKETVSLSANQLSRQKATNRKLIIDLIAVGLIVFTLLPWCVEGGLFISLPMLPDSNFWIMIVLLVLYGVSTNLCDQKKSFISMISYVLLIGTVFLLFSNLVLIKSLEIQADIMRKMTPVPVLSILYALGLMVVHHNLFSSRINIEKLKLHSIDNKNSHLILFSLAVIIVIFVCFVPVINNGVSSKFLLESFVERKPEWYGNYSNNASYHGIILTFGYVSLLLCPLLCLWARTGNVIIYVLTDVALVHILACIANYPMRFGLPINEMISLEYFSACLIPFIMLILNHFMHFHKVFVKKEKEPVNNRLIIIQIIYIMVTVMVFSYLFMVQPFVINRNSYSGEWYLITLLTILCIFSLAFPVFRRIICSMYNKNKVAGKM